MSLSSSSAERGIVTISGCCCVFDVSGSFFVGASDSDLVVLGEAVVSGLAEARFVGSLSSDIVAAMAARAASMRDC